MFSQWNPSQQHPAPVHSAPAPQPVVQPVVQPITQPVVQPVPSLSEVRLSMWLNNRNGPRTYFVVNDPRTYFVVNDPPAQAPPAQADHARAPHAQAPHAQGPPVQDPPVQALQVQVSQRSENAVALSQVAPASVKQPDAVALGLAHTGAKFYKP